MNHYPKHSQERSQDATQEYPLMTPEPDEASRSYRRPLLAAAAVALTAVVAAAGYSRLSAEHTPDQPIATASAEAPGTSSSSSKPHIKGPAMPKASARTDTNTGPQNPTSGTPEQTLLTPGANSATGFEVWRASDRSSSYNEVVRGLDDLERRTNRRMFIGAMEFFTIPHGQAGVSDALSWHPAALRQLDTADYKPTTILEPGDSLQAANANDSRAYFEAMRSAGIKPKQWGRVVVVPELVVGEWNANEPAGYTRNVNTQLRNLEANFPGAEGTILIDTAPQEMNPILKAMRNGNERLDTSRMTSVGVQAYANGQKISFNSDGSADISSYLTVDHIKKIAAATGKQRVWLNTGITKTDDGHGARYTLAQRIAVAEAVADVVEQAQKAGITIEDVMLFAEDKSAGDAGDAGRDFSINPGEERIASTLHDRLRKLGVPLSGFAIKD